MATDIAALRELLAEATPRPWDLLGSGGNPGPHQRYVSLAASDDLVDKSGEPPFEAVCVTEGFDSLGEPDLREEDAEAIVALVNAAPDLLDELDSLRAKQVECDDECMVEMSPMEMCSLHGRPVSEVWELLHTALEAQERIRKLHVQDTWTYYPNGPEHVVCGHCANCADPDSGFGSWPCETILALNPDEERGV